MLEIIDCTTENISITVQQQDNGQYICQLSNSLTNLSNNDIRCYGQTREHAIANALEKLAADYRQIAEDQQQNIGWDEIKKSETGEVIENSYHVILHYEDIIEVESKFEAMHNTIMGNTVVENATITVIEIDKDLPIELLTKSRD
jgi:phosphoribosylformylglycinamidine (FGAM) synthase PurS component